MGLIDFKKPHLEKKIIYRVGVNPFLVVLTIRTMKQKTMLTIFIGLVVLAYACKAPQMLVNSELRENSPAFAVKGRNGFLVGQKISFGPYKTEEVKRGWIKTHQSNFFFINNQSGEQSIHFTLTDSLGNNYTANCAGHLKKEQTDLGFFLGHNNNPIIGELMKITEEYEETYAVTIEADTQTVWNMLVANRHVVRYKGKYKGLLYSQNQTVEINPVRNVEGSNIPFPDVIGFEFTMNGKAIGAVEVLNKGKVFISPDIDEKLKGVVATAAAALLLQTDLESL
jgi:hypothetical protein